MKVAPATVGDIPFWARSRDGVLFEDIPVRPGGRLPDFFIIGAPKAATTSLQAYLGQHPRIFVCDPKEPHFFSTDAIYERGLEWYKGLFADATPEQICGEASTSYTRYPYTPDVPERIRQHVPDARFIYLVRDPIERIESAAVFALRRDRALGEHNFAPSVDEVIEAAEIVIETTEYIEQIEQYLRVFDRDRLLVLLQQDLAEDGPGTMRRVFEFLGVDPEFPVDTSERLNVTSGFVEGLKDEEAGRLAHKIPGYEVIKKIVPHAVIRRVKRAVARRLEVDDVVEPMSPQMRERLRVHFAPYNARLAAFLQRDLHWG